MKLLWTASAWEDYLYRQHADTAIPVRINDLIRDAVRSPFAGIGKPEPLKANLAGWWSRRITGDHRLVYRILGKDAEQRMEIASAATITEEGRSICGAAGRSVAAGLAIVSKRHATSGISA